MFHNIYLFFILILILIILFINIILLKDIAIEDFVKNGITGELYEKILECVLNLKKI